MGDAGGADNMVQVVEGHRGYGDPPDIRRPAQEFYHLNQNPMAVDGNDDLVRPFGARPTIKQRAQVWGGQKITVVQDKLQNVQITSKHLPLHVDEIAEKKRRQYEACGRSVNKGMGHSAVTWLRNRGESHPANHAPWRSAGANHPPRTAKGLVQNIRPGLTRPRSAFVSASRLQRPFYSNRGTDNKGFLVKTEAEGTRDVAHQFMINENDGQADWKGTWPDLPGDKGFGAAMGQQGGEGGGRQAQGEGKNKNFGPEAMFAVKVPPGKGVGGARQGPRPYDNPVVKRRNPPRRVDAWGNPLGPFGLENVFSAEERRGNREAARRMGEGGIFRGEGGGWLKRMWKINAWAEPGGFKGRMPVDKVDKRHRPVGDGWAPPRMGNDGWGQKKWPAKGSHYIPSSGGRGSNNNPKQVDHFGMRPAKKGRPVELYPGCWRGNCHFPHGEDRKDDNMHGLPYEGVSKMLYSGRTMAKNAPVERQSWAARRPKSAPVEFEPSPWSGYGAFHSYF